MAQVLPESVLRRVRQIEITTRKMVDELMGGQYRTQFKGQGVQFSEHRVYIPGDDVRHMDWKVSARTRDPMVKKFEEERELSVFLVVDVSGSGRFGSTGKLKNEVAAEICGMLAYAAVHAGDKVGILLFAGEVEEILPPRKGKQHVLRIIRDVLARGLPGYRPRVPGTNLKGALESAARVMKHSGVVFIISDFLAEGYQQELKRLARRHDVVVIRIGDARETEVPPIGQLLLVDPETGEERLVDTASYAFRRWLEESRRAREAEMTAAFRGSRVENLNVRTEEDYGEAVVRFFRARANRKARG